jgi:predicted transcriptional regulator
MKVEEITIRDYPTIDKDSKIKEALEIMMKKDVDRLIVLRNREELYGIVTEFDILFKLSQRTVKRFQPYNTSIASATTTPIDTIYPDTEIKTAASMMLRRGYSSLPVITNDNKLYGLITKREIIGIFNRYRDTHGRTKILKIMESVKGKINLFNRLVQAERKMRLSGFNTLVVTYEDRFIGIITALDIARTIFTIKKLEPTRRWEYNLRQILVSDIVTRNVDTLTRNSSINDAVDILLNRRQRLIPILEDKKVTGVVSRRHIIKYMLRNNLL